MFEGGKGRMIFDRDVYEHWKTEWAKNGYTPQDVYKIVKAHGLPDEYLGELRAVISEMEDPFKDSVQAFGRESKKNI